MNKKILLISLSTIYIGFMVFAFLLGGIFENWLILDARTLYRGTLLIVPFLIYLVWKKIFTVSVVDRLSPFVFFAMWIVLLLFNKSLINALVIEPPIVLVLSFLYCFFLAVSKTKKGNFGSLVRLGFFCVVFLLIHLNIPLIGE